MPLKKQGREYVCPLGLLENGYMPGFDVNTNPVVLGNCSMCRFGDKSKGPSLNDICQAPETITLEEADRLFQEFSQNYVASNGKCADLNNLSHRKDYWAFIRKSNTK